jgi:hypothetical protein
MQSTAWLDYFESNRARAPQRPEAIEDLDPDLRAALVHAVQLFQIGETGEGRIVAQVRRSDDPAFDDATREVMALYIAEEGRHARELAELLRALGGERLRSHYGEAVFRRARNLFGLRTKMQVLTAAEVIGMVFYGMIVDHVREPTIAKTLGVLAREEVQHLEFQRQWFRRVVALSPRPLQPLHAAALALQFAAILTASLAAATWAHRPLLRALRVPAWNVPLRAVRALLARPHARTQS